MIATTKYPTDAFADAIASTAYMATALLNRGELLLPPRIREHLADGPVVVHLLRGEDDVARYEATLTATSKLVGIEWPADVKPKSRLTVLCPRGGASHDIGVVLPELEQTVTFLGPVPDEPGDEPEVEDESDAAVCTCTPSQCDFDDHDNPFTGDECIPCGQQTEGARCIAREGDYTPVTDEQLAAITGALTALADAAPVVEVARPDPANYEVPTTLRFVSSAAPTETIAAVPADGWPAAEPDAEDDDEIAAVAGKQADARDALDASEETTVLRAVGTLPPFKVALTRAWSAFRRRLTPRRTVLLTAVVAVVVTWAAAWVVMG